MKKRMIVIFVFLIIISSAISYRFGVGVSMNAYSEGLSATQAMLAFNHMKTYEKILKCQEENNFEAVSQNLRMNIITEKELIADHLNKYNTERLNKYISLRYSKPISELKNYKSNRKNSWSEPSC